MSSVNKIRLITIVCSFLAIAIALVLSLLIIRVISNPISKWVHKISDACSESTDILLDDAICAEIVELNGGISHLMDKVRSLMKEKLVEERKKRELEIRILHEQIKPHFLYNALYSIEQLGYLGEFDKVTKIIKSLNGFYRLSLSKGRDVIELKDEIAHAEYYLTIQMIRSKRVSCAVKVDRELLSAKIVKLSLQPLLENALFHGAKHGEDLHLNIEAKKTDSGIKIEVSDDGAGMDFEKVAALQRAFATDDWTALPEVYGIRNVHERIRLHYGPAYGLTIESVLEQGTLVTIFVPESKE